MTSVFESSTNKKIWNFSPAIIPGCVLWLDAADLNTVSTSVSRVTGWKDKSTLPAESKVGGSTGLVVAGTTPSVGTPLNGLNTIAFGGGGILTTTTNVSTLPTGNASGTYFVVARAAASGANPQMMFEYGGSTRNVARTIRGFYFSNESLTSPITDLGTGSQRCETTSAQYTAGTYTIIASTQVGSGADTVTHSGVINGENFSPFPTRTDSEIVTGTAEFNVGGGSLNNAGGTIGFYLTGNVAEILVYSTVLSTAERQQVEGYLAWKWGLSSLITQGAHPYRSTALVKSPYLKPFSLPDILGCVLWLDVSDFKTVTFDADGPVTRWKDKSPVVGTGKVGGSGGLYATGSPTPVFDSVLQNGLATFKFNGSNGFTAANLADTSIPKGNAPGTYFVVGKTTTTSVSGAQMIFQYGNNDRTSKNNRQFYFTENGSKIYTDNNTVGRVKTGDGQYSNSQYSIVTSIQTLESTTLRTNNRINGMEFSGVDFLNNTPASDVDIASNLDAIPVRDTVFSVGRGGPDNTFNLTGNIAEILIYNAVLSVTDILRVEGYLAWKWGLQRGASSIAEKHSFYKFPPATVAS